MQVITLITGDYSNNMTFTFITKTALDAARPYYFCICAAGFLSHAQLNESKS